MSKEQAFSLVLVAKKKIHLLISENTSRSMLLFVLDSNSLYQIFSANANDWILIF